MGARVNPQLPPMTVVTPCTLEGEARRVPEELRVVVGVGVDHSGHHGEAASVELRRARLVDPADGDDTAVPDPDVGETAGLAGAVDDRAGSDDVVEHGTSGGGRSAVGAERRNLTTRQLTRARKRGPLGSGRLRRLGPAAVAPWSWRMMTKAEVGAGVGETWTRAAPITHPRRDPVPRVLAPPLWMTVPSWPTPVCVDSSPTHPQPVPEASPSSLFRPATPRALL